MYGHALIKGGIAVFDELQQSIKQVEALNDPTTSEARIGTVEFLAGGLVFAVLDELTQKYPRAAFDITVTDGSHALLEELRARKIDVALGRVPANTHDEELDMRPLLDEELYVVAGAKSRWSQKRKIRLGDLIDEAWCLPPPHSLAGAQIERIFRSQGLDVPRAAVTSFSLQIHSSLLATGRFLGIVPRSYMHYSPNRKTIKVLPVDLAQERGRVAIVTVRNRTISPMSQLFVDFALQSTKAISFTG
jgi:DNA-binding transcriptional LysR family regulator